MAEIKCWAHEIREPGCAKCASETTNPPPADAGQDMGASATPTGLSPTVEPASSLDGFATSIPSADLADQLHDEIKAAYRAGAEDVLREWAEVCECAPLPTHAGIGETSHGYWNDNQERILASLRTPSPVADEAVAGQVTDRLFAELEKRHLLYSEPYRSWLAESLHAALQQVQTVDGR